MIRNKWYAANWKPMLSWLLVSIVALIAFKQGPEIWTTLKQVQIKWVAAGMGCYYINYLFRAIRFNIIIKKKLNLWPDTIHFTCLHGFLSYLLPFRTGDLALPVIIKTVCDITLSDGAKILLKVRLLDLFTLGICILYFALFYELLIPFDLQLVWIATGVCLIFCPITLYLLIKNRGYFKNSILHWLEKIGDIGIITLKEIILSIGIWAAVGAVFYCTTKAVSLPLNFGEIWVIITIQLPLQLIPVQGFANAGNHEGGWVTALALMGIPASKGLQFAIASHAILLIYVMMLGPVALITKKIKLVNR